MYLVKTDPTQPSGRGITCLIIEKIHQVYHEQTGGEDGHEWITHRGAVF